MKQLNVKIHEENEGALSLLDAGGTRQRSMNTILAFFNYLQENYKNKNGGLVAQPIADIFMGNYEEALKKIAKMVLEG